MGKKVFILAMLGLLLISSVAYAHHEATQVQISWERDTQGRWTAWEDLIVEWETDPTPETEIPDHMSRDDDAQQDWYTPFLEPEGTVWYRFTFIVDRTGEYAVRLSAKGILWCEPETCVVELPASPRHKD